MLDFWFLNFFESSVTFSHSTKTTVNIKKEPDKINVNKLAVFESSDNIDKEKTIEKMLAIQADIFKVFMQQD